MKMIRRHSTRKRKNWNNKKEKNVYEIHLKTSVHIQTNIQSKYS